MSVTKISLYSIFIDEILSENQFSVLVLLERVL